VEQLKGEYGIEEIDWKEADQFEDIIRIESPIHSGKNEIKLEIPNEQKDGSTSIGALRGRGEEIEMEEIRLEKRLSGKVEEELEKRWFGGDFDEGHEPNWE